MGVTETGTRAREPDESGFATAPDGVRVHWEVHGDGAPTLVFLPATPISHSRLWKGQVHPLARRHRVVLFDGRGNGRSGPVDTTQTWKPRWRLDECLAVMDATDTVRAILVGICSDGVWPAVQLAVAHPDRVAGVIAIAPGVPLLTPPHPWRAAANAAFEEEFDDPVGWEKQSRRFMTEHYADFLEFFFGEMFPEPHSTKQVEDAVAYALDGSVEAVLMDEDLDHSKQEVEAVCRAVRCPVLVIQGDRDNCQPPSRGAALAALTGGEHIRLEGAGHIPNARHPILVNRLIRDFTARISPNGHRRRTWTAARSRPRRAILVSSPIGLGHAWRDVAIARELRRQVPDLEVHWLAQPPLTALLAECGEIVHPASAELASEAAHVDAEAGEHELHAFGMLRRLDEIFCANFEVFHDVVEQDPYDLWIADEAWELDYFLHENPELKTAPFVWMTDFVGIVPMDEGGDREAFLAADHNAQMVEHVARSPWIRDRSIFIGEPDDIVPRDLGPDLPGIREWTEPRFAFSGYVNGFAPDEIADRDVLRAELGWRPDEQVCVVAAGGSGVGVHLFERAIAAFGAARRRVPGLRMIVVAGPRVELGALPAAEGLERHGYVHRLYRQLAACDLAITHGGLSTTMELTAAGRPFLFFPLRGHFEQNHHVAHRLARHGAGRRMDWATDGPEELAAAIAEEIGRTPTHRPVDPRGAVRAAEIIAGLL